MERLPIELACYFEYSGVSPEKERRFALYCVSIRSTSVNDFVRHNGIHRFTINWLRMDKGRKANRDREQRNPKHGQAKSSRSIGRYTHPDANYSSPVCPLRE